jgi:hypothetical protein
MRSMVEGAWGKGLPLQKPPLRQGCALPPPRAGEDKDTASPTG